MFSIGIEGLIEEVVEYLLVQKGIFSIKFRSKEDLREFITRLHIFNGWEYHVYLGFILKASDGELAEIFNRLTVASVHNE